MEEQPKLVLKNNIQSRLDENGMTLHDLKGLIGVSYPKMKAIIDGSDLRVSDAQKIAAVFDSEVGDIWTQSFSVETQEVVTEKQVLTFTE